MLSKLKTGSDQSRSSRGGQKKRFKLFSKMTRTASVSSYVRMESDGKKKMTTKVGDAEAKSCKDKENNNVYANQEVKDKKKKKRSWKRIRQAALTTCRYIGMGVAHMNPAAAYGSPDYYVDPKTWNKSFSSSYKLNTPRPQVPHWTSNMMFSGW